MAEQSPEPSGVKAADAMRFELTKLGAILVGLALIVGSLNNQAVQLGGQLLPSLPAPGSTIGRFFVGGVGLLVLAWGLLYFLEPGGVAILRWWQRRVRGSDAERSPDRTDAGAQSDSDPVWWALEGFQARYREGGGGVLFTGDVLVAGDGNIEWQHAAPIDRLMALRWSDLSENIAALAHPVRLLLLRRIYEGVQDIAQLEADMALQAAGGLGTHIQKLLVAGWIQSPTKGQYRIPGGKVIPLLTILAAVAN